MDVVFYGQIRPRLSCLTRVIPDVFERVMVRHLMLKVWTKCLSLYDHVIGCFAVSGTDGFHTVDGTIKTDYLRILQLDS